MLFGSTRKGRFKSLFGALNKRQIPYVAVWATSISIAVGIIITYLAPNKVYIWITSASAFADLWVWAIILLSEIALRRQALRQGRALRFPVPMWPTTPIVGFILVVVAFGAIIASPLTRVSVFSGIIFLALLWIYYFVAVRNRQHEPDL